MWGRRRCRTARIRSECGGRLCRSIEILETIRTLRISFGIRMRARTNLTNQLCPTCSSILLVTLRKDRDVRCNHASDPSIGAVGRTTWTTPPERGSLTTTGEEAPPRDCIAAESSAYSRSWPMTRSTSAEKTSATCSRIWSECNLSRAGPFAQGANHTS